MGRMPSLSSSPCSLQTPLQHHRRPLLAGVAGHALVPHWQFRLVRDLVKPHDRLHYHQSFLPAPRLGAGLSPPLGKTLAAHNSHPNNTQGCSNWRGYAIPGHWLRLPRPQRRPTAVSSHSQHSVSPPPSGPRAAGECKSAPRRPPCGGPRKSWARPHASPGTSSATQRPGNVPGPGTFE